VATFPWPEERDLWTKAKYPLKFRWHLLHSPKGLNIHEYIIFRKQHWGWKWIIFAIKAYFRTLFPESFKKS